MMSNVGQSRPKIEQFVHCNREIIRWGDMDAFGHVNNVQFFRYLESARVAYSSEVVGSCPQAEGESVILADQRCSFLRQLIWPGELDVYTRMAGVGRTSMHLTQIICHAGESKVIAIGAGVMVWFDFEAQKPARIPDALRQRIVEYERLRPEGL